jgi:hypothetical protein
MVIVSNGRMHGYVKVLTVKCIPEKKCVNTSVADNWNFNTVMSNYVLL